MRTRQEAPRWTPDTALSDAFGPTELAWSAFDLADSLYADAVFDVVPSDAVLDISTSVPFKLPANAAARTGSLSQLALFPAPQVAVEFSPGVDALTAAGTVSSGAYRAWVRGLEAPAGQGASLETALHALAIELKEFATDRSGDRADPASANTWAVYAAQRFCVLDLAKVLSSWAEQVVLDEVAAT